MRLDHIAYRVSDKEKAAQFFIDSMNYKIEDEFKIEFDDGTCANCYAMSHPDKGSNFHIDQTGSKRYKWSYINFDYNGASTYHIPPEIFVSEGTKGSIVDKWVSDRSGVGGIHHLAYQVHDVEYTMNEWKTKDWAEFTTEKPIKAKGLVQCFTKPHPITGIIYEFINREEKGFNIDNVKDLMTSTIGV